MTHSPAAPAAVDYLLTLPEGDKGSGVIKPSGSDQTVAIISDDHLLVQPKDFAQKL